MTPIRVLLAEDHTLVRAGLRALLQNMDDVQVVGEAGDGRAAVRLAREHRPDVVLLDITMPELNGLEALAQIIHDQPHTRVIMLSMHATEAYVTQALRNGAAGYVLKDAGTAELDVAVRAVVRGEIYLSPGVSKHIVGAFLRQGDYSAGPRERLTSRQREILQLIAEGKTTKAIADSLGISAKTVDTHRAQLMDQLNIHDIAGLVRYAIRMGIIAAE